MKSDVETLNPTRVKFTVAVPYAELKPQVDAAYKSLAGQVQVPGFRRGKVPPRVIDQRFGRSAVIQEAVNDAIPHLFQQAVNESSLHPLGTPDVAVTDLPTGVGTDAGELRFTVEIDVRPTLDLPDYASLEVTVDEAAVTDADVEEALEKLRKRFGTLSTAERGAAEGDVVTIDLSARIEDEEVDSAQGMTYEIGSDGVLPGLDAALTGAGAGETVTFEAPLVGGDRAGETAAITVSLEAVKARELPTLDDDFAQLASEFDTLEELRADLRATAAREKKFGQGLQARDKVLATLLERVDVPVPDSVVAAEVHQHLENESRLDDDAHRAEVGEQTRAVLREHFLLDSIAEAEQVTVSQEELVEYLMVQAPRYGMDVNTFARAMGEAGQVEALVGEVARRKALAIVLSHAKVTDTSGAPVDFGADDEADDEGVEAGDAVTDVAADAPSDPASDVEAGADATADAEPPAKPKRTRAPKAAAAAPAEGEASEGETAPKRRRTTKAPAADAEPAGEATADAEAAAPATVDAEA